MLTFTHVRGGCNICCIRPPRAATGLLIGLELGWKCIGRGARAFGRCNGVPSLREQKLSPILVILVNYFIKNGANGRTLLVWRALGPPSPPAAAGLKSCSMSKLVQVWANEIAHAVHVVNLVYYSTASITSIKCTTDSSLQRL